MRKSESTPPPQNSEAAPEKGRRLAPEDRRAALLEAALPCFARRGYAGTGTRDLARDAGVSEPILYRHFPSKAELFRAVLEQAGDRLLAAVEEAVDGYEGADARLHALAGALPGLFESYGSELRVVNAGALVLEEPEITTAAAAVAQRIGRALGAAFRGPGLRAGVRAETAGFLLLEIGLGAAMLHPLRLPEMETEGFGARAVELLLHGLA